MKKHITPLGTFFCFSLLGFLLSLQGFVLKAQDVPTYKVEMTTTGAVKEALIYKVPAYVILQTPTEVAEGMEIEIVATAENENYIDAIVINGKPVPFTYVEMFGDCSYRLKVVEDLKIEVKANRGSAPSFPVEFTSSYDNGRIVVMDSDNHAIQSGDKLRKGTLASVKLIPFMYASVESLKINGIETNIGMKQPDGTYLVYFNVMEKTTIEVVFKGSDKVIPQYVVKFPTEATHQDIVSVKVIDKIRGLECKNGSKVDSASLLQFIFELAGGKRVKTFKNNGEPLPWEPKLNDQRNVAITELEVKGDVQLGLDVIPVVNSTIFYKDDEADGIASVHYYEANDRFWYPVGNNQYVDAGLLGKYEFKADGDAKLTKFTYAGKEYPVEHNPDFPQDYIVYFTFQDGENEVQIESQPSTVEVPKYSVNFYEKQSICTMEVTTQFGNKVTPGSKITENRVLTVVATPADGYMVHLFTVNDYPLEVVLDVPNSQNKKYTTIKVYEDMHIGVILFDPNGKEVSADVLTVNSVPFVSVDKGIKLTENCNLEIISINGSTIVSEKGVNGKVYNLPAGAYIVKIDGQSYKCVVK